MNFRMARFRGRAPYWVSLPFAIRKSLAAGVTSTVIFCSLRRRFIFVSIISMICSKSFLSSGWKRRISSIRFKNSGRKKRFTSSMISLRDVWAIRSFEVSLFFPTKKPISAESFCKRREPKLLVIIITVLRKSTVRP